MNNYEGAKMDTIFTTAGAGKAIHITRDLGYATLSTLCGLSAVSGNSLRDRRQSTVRKSTATQASCKRCLKAESEGRK